MKRKGLIEGGFFDIMAAAIIGVGVGIPLVISLTSSFTGILATIFTLVPIVIAVMLMAGLARLVSD